MKELRDSELSGTGLRPSGLRDRILGEITLEAQGEKDRVRLKATTTNYEAEKMEQCWWLAGGRRKKGPETNTRSDGQPEVHDSLWSHGSQLIGSSCVDNIDCEEIVANSRCLEGRCACKPYHATFNMTACLPASLLGASCVTEAQCTNRVPNSECKEAVCSCKHGFLQYRKHTCLEAARPGSVCYGHAHCRMWDASSRCDFLIPGLFGRCQCAHGTKLVGDSCALPEEVINFHIEVAKVNKTSSVAGRRHGSESPSIRRVDAELPKRNPTRTQVSQNSPILQINFKRDTFGGNINKLQSGAHGNRLPVSALVKGSTKKPATIGTPCLSDVQCKAADPNSRCILGICDCAIVAPNATSPNCGAKYNGCAPTTFQCRTVGRCISYFFVCDGRKDCPDGSDEFGCDGLSRPGSYDSIEQITECPVPSFRCEVSGRCVSLSARCDGSPQCPHGEDEAGCRVGKGQTCPAHTFACGDGQCLPEYEFCNSVIGCSDGSDEAPQICRHGHAQLSRGARNGRRGTYKYR
ncbi:uncharacterized protein LOC113384121 [Ctenocephalides felis]|uniref:uncharacterized protein LOC113384121 n=1 Tax=Ctenocephalides felis TaxID=7515 RepID=UPI000E6E2EED|nr:uncharacterized protein LOC113384121 [Ctenocephalides felis]